MDFLISLFGFAIPIPYLSAWCWKQKLKRRYPSLYYELYGDHKNK